MNRSTLFVLLIVTLAFTGTAVAQAIILRIGSKPFTESVILAEIVKRLSIHHGQPAQHLAELGGSRILWNALRKGDIDVYPEYVGTITSELLPGVAAESDA